MARKNLFALPLVGKILRQIDTDIAQMGIQQALLKVADKTNTRLKTHFVDSKTPAILTDKPVVLIFNHPYEIETMVISATLPKRYDAALIMTAHFLDVLPNLNPYILPVYVDHHATREKAGKVSGKIVKLFKLRPAIDLKFAREYNRKTINKAVTFVKNGGLVKICPEGFRGKNGAWFSGVGHLVKGVGTNSQTSIVFAYVKNTLNWDWFRIVPFVGKIMPPLEVYYSTAQKITKQLTNNSPSEIKELLHNQYQQFALSVNN